MKFVKQNTGLLRSVRSWGALGLVLALAFVANQGQGQGTPPWVRNKAAPNIVELLEPRVDTVVIGPGVPQGKLTINGGNLYLNGLLNCGMKEGCIGPGALSISAIASVNIASGAVTASKLAPCTAPGQFLKWSGAAWTCDTAPIYSAGPGLMLSSATFRIATSEIVATFSIATNGIVTGMLADGAVTRVKLGSDSVDSSKVVNGSLTSADIGDGEIGSADIADHSITADDLHTDSVGSDAIQNDAVDSAEIKDGDVKQADLADGAVNSAKIADGAINAAKIDTGAITEAKMAADSVISSKIKDLAVIRDKIADLAINTDKIDNGAISSQKLANGAVTFLKLAPCTASGQFLKWSGTAWTCDTAPIYIAGPGLMLSTSAIFSIATSGIVTGMLADSAVTRVKLGTDSVDSSKIVDGSVTSSDISDGTIGSADIADHSITADDLATNSVGSDAIQNDAVDSAEIKDGDVKLADLGSDSVDSTKIVNGSLKGEDLENGAITDTKMATDSVISGKIKNLAVIRDKIADLAINAAKIEDGAITLAKIGVNCAVDEILKKKASGWGCASDAGGVGTITAVTAGSGLTGGGISGAVTLSLLTCATDQILKSTAAGWACAADKDTTYSAGTGLSLSPTNVFSLAPPTSSTLGGVKSSTCTSTDKVTGIDAAGAITCSADVNTAYSAGLGLSLTGTVFSLLTSCAANQILKWNGTTWTCAADANSGGTVTSVTAGSGLTGGTIMTTGTIALAPPTSSTLGGVKSSTCTGTDKVAGIDAAGAITCSADVNTAYSAGLGLSLTGTTFSVNSSIIQTRVTGNCNSSPPGMVGAIQAVNQDGSVTCQSVGAGTITAVNTPAGSGLQGGGTSGALTLALMPCPSAGTSPSPIQVMLGTVLVATTGETKWNCATVDKSLLLPLPTPAGFTLGLMGCAVPNQILLWDGINWNCAPYGAAGAPPGGWSLGGNPITPGQFLGTTNNEPFELRVNNNAALRISPAGGGGNRFELRAAGGGMHIFSDPLGSVGVQLMPGGNSWSAISDRHMKEHFVSVDGRSILQKLSLIPVTQWNLKSQDPSIHHLGPMAQDFYAAFGLGEDNRYISSSDADGIALISIQALYELSLEKDKKIEALQQSNEELRASNAAMQAQLGALLKRLEALEQAVKAQSVQR